jgi:hypothetical protein
VIAVGAAFGQWLTMFLRQIPPGHGDGGDRDLKPALPGQARQ